MPPVQRVGVIEKDSQAPLFASGVKFPNQVPLRRGFHAVVIRLRGLEQAETIVVARGEVHVTHPGVLRQLGNRIGIEGIRRKAFLQLFVLPKCHRFAQLHPLPFPHQRVQPVVQKEPELEVAEPFRTLSAAVSRRGPRAFLFAAA